MLLLLLLFLFCCKFILQSINLLLEFLDGSLSKLSSGLCLLQFSSQSLDLLLVAGLSLVGLVLRHLQRLEIGSNNSQLLLQLDDLQLSSFSSLLSSLKLGLNLLESLLNLFVLLVSFLSLIPGILQLLLQHAHSLLILDCSVLQDFPHSVRVISSSGGLVEFIGSNKKFVLTFLQIFLKTLDSSVQSIDFQLS